MEPRDAATVLLIRDVPDLHVFMLRRNLRSAFAAGAYVFPGGAVDTDDDTPALNPGGRVPGPSVPIPIGFRVAAIREAFEEAGVLLARDARSGAPVDASSLASARLALRRGERTFTEIVRDLDVVLDTSALWPIARFITPVGAPRRFDAWFFVAAAPEGHEYRHDEHETVASAWKRPETALQESRRGAFELIEPTSQALATIAPFRRTGTLLDAVRAAWRDDPSPPIEPSPARGWVLPIGAEDAGRFEANAPSSVRRRTSA